VLDLGSNSFHVVVADLAAFLDDANPGIRTAAPAPDQEESA